MLSLQKWLSERRTCSALLPEFRVPAGWREQSRQEAGMDTLCGGVRGSFHGLLGRRNHQDSKKRGDA